jgi:AsmA protein
MDGRLALDPVAAMLAGGKLAGHLLVDARPAEPPVALLLRAPGLPAAELAAMLGEPPEFQGAVDVDADLRAAGRTPNALATSLSGHLGVAMVDGAIDNRLISGTLGQVLQRARLPDITARPGQLPVRCLALRLELTRGVGQATALLLDTPLFYIQGGGSIDLGQETLALRLRPLARLGGTGVIVPLRVAGPMVAPKVEEDIAGAAGEAAGAVEGRQGGPLGLVIGALGGDGMMQGGGGDACPAQLAAARGGASGAAPAAPPPPMKPPKPADLLRQFLR